MGIELVRIDDRLIHGQVANTWVNDYRIEQILIINDATAKDEIQKSVISMTAPPNIKVNCFGVEQFIDIYAKTTIKRRTMLLLTNSLDVLAIKIGKVIFDQLNVGGMRFHEGKQKISPSVYVNEQEYEAFKKLEKLGVAVTIQMVPSDEKVTF